MKYKKMLMLAILLVALLAVSTVNAAENTTDDIVGIDETTDEVMSVENDNEGSFTDLANEIANATGEFNLTRDYAYANDDPMYINGITIDKKIVINGNGHTIDGNNQARIFNVTASNVVINNINFVKCDHNNGAAIHWGYSGENGILFACSFVNCSDCAVIWRSDYGVLSNCTFINCTSNSGPGAISWDSHYSVLANCTFANCNSQDSLRNRGGAINWQAYNSVMANCSFESCYSRNVGGAFYSDSDLSGNCILANCSFVECSANGDGGAIYWGCSYSVLANCSFEKCSSRKANGGAIYCDSYSLDNFCNCSFNDCSAYENGGAIHNCRDRILIDNCSFVNGNATMGGGIYCSSTSISIINSTFEGNSAQNGSDWYSIYAIDLINITPSNIIYSVLETTGDINMSYGDSKSLTVTLSDVNSNLLVGHPITISLNNVSYTKTTDNNGQASLGIPTTLLPGSYIAYISYPGNAEQLAYISNTGLTEFMPINTTVNVTVNKGKTVISCDDVSVEYNDDIVLIATLTNEVSGKPITNAKVVINLNNVDYNVKTDSKGRVKVSVNGLAPNKYAAAISYLGNAKYTPASATARVTVNNVSGTFTDLATEIANAEGELNLTRNYKYLPDNDYSYKDGIIIDKSITINGNGHTINGNNQARAFYINAHDVILNNIAFLNEYASSGGSVVWYGDNGTLVNCSFVKCFSQDTGGAVDWRSPNGVIGNCSFVNCQASNDGGAVYCDGDYGILSNCSFVNSSSCRGGGIYCAASDFTLINSTFEGNSAQNGSDWYSIYPLNVINITPNDTMFTVLETASDVNMSYGESKKLTITLLDINNNYLAGHPITISLNNVSYAKTTDNNGQVSLDIPSTLLPGSYIAYISYPGNAEQLAYISDAGLTEYMPITTTADITVDKGKTVISCDAISVKNDDVCMFVATLTNEANGKPIVNAKVAVNINDVDYNVKSDSKGRVKVSINGLDSDSYIATVSYLGNVKYAPANTTAAVVVVSNKMNTSISACDVHFTYGDVGVLVATLSDVNGNPICDSDVVVVLNKVKYHLTTDSNGQVNFSISGLAARSYPTHIIYYGDDNYNPCDVTVYSQVERLDTVIYAPSAVSVNYGEVAVLVATLKDVNGNPICGERIWIHLDNMRHCLITDSQGQVSFSAADLLYGSYPVIISYGASYPSNYSSARLDTRILVKANIDISTSYDADTRELTATLINSGTGKAMAGAEVQINLNGITTSVRTDSKGQVKISTAGLSSDNYTAVISYRGKSMYNPTSITVKGSVKADMVISADYDSANDVIVATLRNSNDGNAVANVSVKVSLNYVDYALTTDSKGQVKVSTSNLPVGTFTATFYAVNSKYNSVSTRLTFSTKSGVILSAFYDEYNRKIVATLTNDDGRALSNANIKVVISGFQSSTFNVKTNSKGQVNISTVNVVYKEKTATLTYAGNSRYKPASVTVSLDVKTKVIITDVYGYSDKVVATLTNSATGNPIVNAYMQVEINGANYTVKSDSKSQISIDTSDLGLTSYDVKISYRGNSKYTPSSATVAIDLNKANMNIKYFYNKNTKELVATLKNSKTGKVVSNAKMVVDINGVKTTLKSNNKGQIRFSTARFAQGTHVGTVTYGGNDRYNSISSAFKVDI